MHYILATLDSWIKPTETSLHLGLEKRKVEPETFTRCLYIAWTIDIPIFQMMRITIIVACDMLFVHCSEDH